MLLKNYIVEQNLDSMDTYKFLLFFGENEGYKENIKKKIKK